MLLSHLLWLVSIQPTWVDFFYIHFGRDKKKKKKKVFFICSSKEYRESEELRTVSLTKHAYAANLKQFFFLFFLPVQWTFKAILSDMNCATHMPLYCPQKQTRIIHEVESMTWRNPLKDGSTEQQIDPQVAVGQFYILGSLRGFLGIHANLLTHGGQDSDIWTHDVRP